MNSYSTFCPRSTFMAVLFTPEILIHSTAAISRLCTLSAVQQSVGHYRRALKHDRCFNVSAARRDGFACLCAQLCDFCLQDKSRCWSSEKHQQHHRHLCFRALPQSPPTHTYSTPLHPLTHLDPICGCLQWIWERFSACESEWFQDAWVKIGFYAGGGEVDEGVCRATQLQAHAASEVSEVIDEDVAVHGLNGGHADLRLMQYSWK